MFLGIYCVSLLFIGLIKMAANRSVELVYFDCTKGCRIATSNTSKGIETNLLKCSFDNFKIVFTSIVHNMFK